MAVAATEYSFETPQPLWSEQDPALWWDGAQQSIRAVLAESGVSAEEVAAVGLTGQMHGLVLLDEAGEVLRPSILWNDQRTGAQCDEIRATGRQVGVDPADRATTRSPASPHRRFCGCARTSRTCTREVRHILLPKDYLRYKLSGEMGTDKAGAAGTLLLGLTSRDWSQEVLDALDIPLEYLPPDL